MPDHAEKTKFYTINPGESDPQTISTLVVGIVGIALAWVIIMGLEVIFHKTAKAEFERKIVQQESAPLLESRAKQQQRLDGYHWVNEAAGTVAIPIEQAMDAVIENDRLLRSDK